MTNLKELRGPYGAIADMLRRGVCASTASVLSVRDEDETKVGKNETARKDVVGTVGVFDGLRSPGLSALIASSARVVLTAEDFTPPYVSEITAAVDPEIAKLLVLRDEFWAAVRDGAPVLCCDAVDAGEAGPLRQGSAITFFMSAAPLQVAGLLLAQGALIEAGRDEGNSEGWAVATSLKDHTRRNLIPEFHERFDGVRLANSQVTSHLTRFLDDLGQPRSEQFLPYLGALSRESRGVYFHNAGLYSCLEMLRGQVACYVNMSCPAHDAAYLAALWTAVAGPSAVSDFAGDPLVWDKPRFDIIVGHPSIRAEIVDVFKSVTVHRGGPDAC